LIQPLNARLGATPMWVAQAAVAMVCTGAGCLTTGREAERLGQPEIDYIHDQSRFKKDGDASLSREEAKAISLARAHLVKRFGLFVKGSFRVARSRTGYQVHFHNLHTRRGDGFWQEVVEGFGDVFLSNDLRVVKADIGP